MIEFNVGARELYDLVADPTELTDLLTSGTDYSAVVTELQASANSIRQ